MWSNGDKKYGDVPIIFRDFKKSNWSWDPEAKAYYWHRFFHHQPELNYENPAVLREVINVLRFWLDQDVDGLRLDAVPYLVEREGTICENLPETPRTAELHLALASDSDDSSFAPEPMVSGELEQLAQRFIRKAEAAVESLKRSLPLLTESLQRLALTVLNDKSVLEQIQSTAKIPGPILKTRVHGDYHLGQILWSKNDFFIVDFDGEHGRTIAERRARHSSLASGIFCNPPGMKPVSSAVERN